MKSTFATIALLLTCAAAEAQFRASEPFRVPSSSAPAGAGSVAINRSGAFVMAWERHGTDRDIYARRFAPGGEPLGPEFAVNVVTAGNQWEPDVAIHDDGSFAVAWYTVITGGRVYIRRFDANGVATSGEMLAVPAQPKLVNFDIAMHPNGEVLLVTQLVHTTSSELTLRRIGRDGAEAAPPVRVNTTTIATINTLTRADIGINAQGEFVVAWYHPEPGGRSVRAQRFTSDAVPVGGEIVVKAVTKSVYRVKAAMAGDGSFAIGWSEENVTSDAFVQTYTAAGAPSARIAMDTPATQLLIGLTYHASNEVVAITWETPGMLFQRYDRNGAPAGKSLKIDTAYAGPIAGNGAEMINVRSASLTEITGQRIHVGLTRRRAVSP